MSVTETITNREAATSIQIKSIQSVHTMTGTHRGVRIRLRYLTSLLRSVNVIPIELFGSEEIFADYYFIMLLADKYTVRRACAGMAAGGVHDRCLLAILAGSERASTCLLRLLFLNFNSIMSRASFSHCRNFSFYSEVVLVVRTVRPGTVLSTCTCSTVPLPGYVQCTYMHIQ